MSASSPEPPAGSSVPGGAGWAGERAGVDQAALRAESLNSLGRYDQALAVASQALASDPGDSELLIQAAVAHLGLGAPEESRRLLHSAAAVDPGSARVHRILSFVALEEGLVPEAVQAGLRAVQLSPFDALAHAQVGRALARQGDRTSALAAAGRAVELAPDSAEIHIAMADVLFPDGTRPRKADLARAEEHLGRALQIEPGSAAALNDLARVHLARGHGVRAAGHLASAVRADPMTELMQRNMDVVFISLVIRAYWTLYAVWILTRTVVKPGHSDYPLWLPLVIVLTGWGVIGWGLRRLRSQIPVHLGAFVRGFVRRERLGSLWVVCLAGAALLLLAFAVQPEAGHMGLLSWAVVPLFAGFVLSWVRVWLARRRR